MFYRCLTDIELSDFLSHGMLVYNGACFLQAIEGEEEQLLQLFENLKKDSRHTDINVLDIRTIEQKDFQDWSMGVVTNLEAINQAIFEINGSYTLVPTQYNYDEALEILKKLTHLL